MSEGGIVALATQLASVEPATCDRVALSELVALSQQARGWLDAFDARIAMTAARLAEHGHSESARDVLAGGGRRAAREAAAAARRGGLCERLGKVHDALADGTVSAGHVDAIARLHDELDDAGRAELVDLEPTIVAAAAANSVEAFDQEMRDLGRALAPDGGTSRLARLKQARKVRRWMDRQTGMCHTHLELDPETDARVAAALGAAIAAARARHQDDDVDFDHLKTDALVELITGARSNDPRVPEITVLIDLQTLINGLHDDTVCETGDGNHLPPDTVRRLCCDGDIIPLVLGGDGVPLDHGRQRRLATREQRRALRAMYRSCGHPGCTVRFEDCRRIHHVQWWEHLGPTDLANLIPLCEAHHHLVHEGGWTLSLKPDRTITLRRPDGSLSYEGITTDATPTGPPTPPPAPASPAPGNQQRPGETEIPLHLRRAARRQPAAPPTATPNLFDDNMDVTDVDTSYGDTTDGNANGSPSDLSAAIETALARIGARHAHPPPAQQAGPGGP